MGNRQIVQEALDQVGREIGRLQGKLFVVEAASESLKHRLQRLDAVFQNLQTQLQASTQPKPPTQLSLSTEEVIEILRDRLPVLDPANQETCMEVLSLLQKGATPHLMIARMESHAWKQGEAIALAQKVVQCLRS